MPAQKCILTTKDVTILEVMYDRLRLNEPTAPILKAKLENATVVFREDIPADVATLSSRVTYSVNGGEADTRILSHERMSSPIGMYLPITAPRGLALLGMAERGEFVVSDGEGNQERIRLEKVLYQPEAAQREKTALGGLHAPLRRRPHLALVPSVSPAGLQHGDPYSGHDLGHDDPGPSAA